MLHLCPITRLRDQLGRYVQLVARDHDRVLITRNGRELAGLVPAHELELLDAASTRSMDYKAYQVAQEMLRWRIVKEGLEAAGK
ncbi:MAG: type II toxin-antitoxin system Phd/YefM family antitoxin [Pseudodonghicola sp.]|nr:type II toxin-antitoxin system Phd/YefM family antitoxin [Pseudodonghicola sp.]